MSNSAIAAALIPIVWFLIQYCISGPLEKLAKEKLPPKIAEILTKQYFPDKNRK